MSTKHIGTGDPSMSVRLGRVLEFAWNVVWHVLSRGWLPALLVVGAVVAVREGLVERDSAEGCFLADEFDYVTKQCVLIHLQRPHCNAERDILAVDEINDASYTDDKGKRVEMRSVIYQFKKRPLRGPVSADILRDTDTLYKNAQGQWKAGCER